MKVAVVGMGSIGTRHYANLADELGCTVRGVDIGEKLPLTVDCAFVCTPTSEHLKIATIYVDRGIPVFIEKPLADTLPDLDFADDINWHQSSMVACNLRFTSTVQSLRSFKPALLDAYVSTNDTKFKYGDIALEDIHEFDYIQYCLGEVDSIEFIRKSKWEYDACMFLRGGRIAFVHGDRTGKRYDRHAILDGMKLEITTDNSMYVAEAKHFLKCVMDTKRSMNHPHEASKLTRRLLDALHRCHHPSAKNVNEIS